MREACCGRRAAGGVLREAGGGRREAGGGRREAGGGRRDSSSVFGFRFSESVFQVHGGVRSRGAPRRGKAPSPLRSAGALHKIGVMVNAAGVLPTLRTPSFTELAR